RRLPPVGAWPSPPRPPPSARPTGSVRTDPQSASPCPPCHRRPNHRTASIPLLAYGRKHGVAASRRPRVSLRLLGPVGEVVAGEQGVRVLGARHPLAHRQ